MHTVDIRYANHATPPGVKASHVGIGILAGQQTIPEQRLAAVGAQRTCVIEVPYFSTALRSVAGADLVATVPKRMAMAAPHDPAVRIVDAPVEMSGFRYLMAWHPRVDTDAAHVWLRSKVRAASQELADLGSSRSTRRTRRR
jgi:DNA-binding transcriptional LysR family regulator